MKRLYLSFLAKGFYTFLSATSCTLEPGVASYTTQSSHPGEEDIRNHVEYLDAACGRCHNSGEAKEVPLEKLIKWTDDSKDIHKCLESHQCYAENVSKMTATTCLDQCFEDAEPLGFFRATLYNGIASKLANTAEKEIAQALLAQAMPPRPPSRAEDISANIPRFRNMLNRVPTAAMVFSHLTI